MVVDVLFCKEFGVPIALIIVGAGAKSLANFNWEWEYIMMGPDLLLAAIAAMLVHIIDTQVVGWNGPPANLGAAEAVKWVNEVGLPNQHGGTALTWLLVFTSLAFLAILRLHQLMRLARKNESVMATHIYGWMCFLVGNAMGTFAFFGLFTLLRRYLEHTV